MSPAMRTGLVMLVFVGMLAVGTWVLTTTLLAANEAPVVSDDAPEIAKAAIDDETTTQHNQAAAQPSRVESTSQPAARPFPNDATWIEVKVVDREFQPQADTQVHWRCGRKRPIRSEVLGSIDWRQPKRAALREGWSTTTDADGKARIACRGTTYVIAERPGWFGSIELPGPDAPEPQRRVVLLPDIALRALVLGPDDQPVEGVPITFSASDREDDIWYSDSAMGISDADGIAEIRHFQITLAEMRSDTWFEGIDTGQLCLFLPGMPVTGPTVSLSSPPTEPLVLRMPEFGSVRVATEHTDLVSITCEEGDSFGDGMVVDGIAVIDHLPVGKRYTARGHGPHGSVAQFTGPAVHGEQVDVALRPSKNRILVRARLLDGNGQIVANTRMRMQLKGKGCARHTSFTTDGEGRFTVNAGRKRAKEARIESGWIDHGDAYDDLGRVAIPPRNLTAGIHELGDLTLQRGADLIAAGRILVGTEPCTSKLYPMVGRFQQLTTGKRRYVRYPKDMSLSLDAQGRFEIWSERVPGDFTIRVRDDRFLPVDPIPFAIGDTDIEIRLTPCHSMRATILLPEVMTPDMFLCRVVPTDAQPLPDATAYRYECLPERVQEDRCEALWEGLPAGKYAIEISQLAWEQPFLRIDNVQVPQVGDGDPRLNGIRISDHFRIVTIRLWDGDRKPLEEYGALFRELPQSGSEVRAHSLDGHVSRIAIRKNKTSFLAAVMGFQPTPVVIDRPVVDIQMFPWPKVTLELAAPPKLPDGVYLQATLVPEQPIDGSWESENSSDSLQQVLGVTEDFATIKNGKVDLRVGHGPHRARLRLRRRRGPRLLLPSRTIGQVLPTTGRFRVEIDPDALRRTLANLEARSKQSK